MATGTRLYERAGQQEKPGPLLHVGADCSFWTGETDYLAEHRGSAPVFLASLYGKFRLRLTGQSWTSCQAAILPPGIWHELDFGGEPFAALYVEPTLGGLEVLKPLLRQAGEVRGALLGTTEEVPLLRSFHNDLRSELWAEQALRDLLISNRRRAVIDAPDPRLAAVVEFLHKHCDDLTPVDTLARRVGLSSSRFQHLFTQQMGIPFRHYRLWNKLRITWREIAKGVAATTAAHTAGFFDSAHFAHEYRRTFGKACSNGLRRFARTTSP